MKKTMPLLVLSLLFLLLFTTCTHENNNQQVILNAVKDVDGNSYDAVRIGDQVWMKTNLRTKHFRDGSEIGCYEPTWRECPGYDKKTYGLCYSWSIVADERGLCPEGWHVPSDKEWDLLAEYVGGQEEYAYNGDPIKIAKSLASTIGWKKSFAGGGCPGYHRKTNNATGFSAIPIGRGVLCDSAGYYTEFWSSTPHGQTFDDGYALSIILSYNRENLLFLNESSNIGLSVRCVKD